jgi:hypothetical protein
MSPFSLSLYLLLSRYIPWPKRNFRTETTARAFDSGRCPLQLWSNNNIPPLVCAMGKQSHLA